MIEFQEIDRHNFFDVIDLKVRDEQKSFVATNEFSLAQAKVFPECFCLAICKDDVLVGFTMYCQDAADKEYWIYRLMIDKKFQSKGYGKAAMEKLIDQIKEDKEYRVIYLSFESENDLARKLYEKLGFQADGRVIDGEVVYKLEYLEMKAIETQEFSIRKMSELFYLFDLSRKSAKKSYLCYV